VGIFDSDSRPKIFKLTSDQRCAVVHCAGSGVQELTPAGVSVFQPELEQDQEWILLIGPGSGAGMIFRECF